MITRSLGAEQMQLNNSVRHLTSLDNSMGHLDYLNNIVWYLGTGVSNHMCEDKKR